MYKNVCMLYVLTPCSIIIIIIIMVNLSVLYKDTTLDKGQILQAVTVHWTLYLFFFLRVADLTEELN